MNRLWILALLFVTAYATRLPAQVPLAKVEATFQTTKGLDFKLWASEPLFVNPTCMDIDHKGRVWVVESVNYRNKLRNKKLTRAEGDRIVILEDTQGQGKANKATTFYQHPDIMAPLGIAVAQNPRGPGCKVFVCQSPDILVFDDQDGDGKADGPPRKLLTNFRGIDHDHGVHGILIGPDMKLYFSVGDSGVGGLQSSDGSGRKWTSNSTDCRAGTVWRCDLDGKNLELIAHNFRNEYEPCVDSFGSVFVSDNDDDGNQQTRICHVITGGNYGYHATPKKVSHWNEELPGVMPKILRTYFGSPTGICVYEGKLLPPSYQNQLLHTDAGPRHVRCYRLTPRGASYSAEQENIVSSSDNWFRPSDVCVAPDGSVFVADWYDPGVGGHNMGDITYGRVFRLAPTGKAAKTPTVDLSSNKGVLEALASPALSVRYMAMAHIAGLKKADAVALLTPAVTNKAEPILRARALWQLARVSGKEGKGGPLTDLLDDTDPRFVVLGLRIARDFLGYDADALSAALKRQLQKKADPQVLREGLVLLRDQDPDKVKATIYDLMKQYDGKDRHYLACVGIAVGHPTGPEANKRRELILADFEKHFATWDDRMAGLVWELRPASMLPLLRKQVSDPAVVAEHRASIVDILATSDETEGDRIILGLLQQNLPPVVQERVLSNLQTQLPNRWQGLRQTKEMDAALDKLLGKSETRPTALRLIAAANRTDRIKSVATLAANNEESQETRKAALESLGNLRTDDAITALVGLSKSAPDNVRLAAIKALGEQGRSGGPKDAHSKKATAALADLLTTTKATQPMREATVSALTASRPGSIWLLEAKTKGALPESVLASAGRLLRNSPYQDLRNKALIAFPPPGRLDLKKLPTIAVLAQRRGNPDKGREILAASLTSNLACLKCHGVRGTGGAVGPDLSMIGKKVSRENLIESILFPSKAVADQYVTWTVETKNGLSVSGLLVEDSPNGVVLRDAEGRDTRIKLNNVENRLKSPKSLMPDDLVGYMSEEELLDLTEYLLTLKTAALTVPVWDIVGPFDNGKGMEGLDREFGPEKRLDLKDSYDGKYGKVTWKTVRPQTNGYVDLKAHYGDKSANIVSYLTAEVESPADLQATFLLGTDDGAKLWVNGQLAHTNRQTRAAAPEQESVKVKLKKGANRLTIKINNGDGPHGLYLTLLSDEELKPLGKR